MANWIGLGLTILGFIITIVRMWERLNTRMDNSEGRLSEYGRKQENQDTRLGGLESAAGIINQLITDHEARDNDSFRRIENYMEEMRGDIKELLKRNNWPRP